MSDSLSFRPHFFPSRTAAAAPPPTARRLGLAGAILLAATLGCRHEEGGEAPAPQATAETDAARTASSGATPETRLREQLERLRSEFRGRVGIYVRRLPDGKELAFDADEVFPTASLIKLPIAIALCARVERGEVSWTAPIAFEKSRIYSQDDLLARLAEGARTSVAELTDWMLARSDNSASLWCQELAGGGAAINEFLAARGYRATRVNSRTPGRESEKAKFGWGQTTPREMAELLVSVRTRRAVSPAADETLDRLLGRSQWVEEALSAVPPEIHVISKQGAVNASRSEVLIVSAPSGDYVLCVITAEQVDTSWTPENEGFRLLRAVSAAAWSAFEPGRPYLGAPRWPSQRNG